MEDKRVGTLIGGKWRVDSLLGAGSMASVYAITHRNGSRAAIKILHETLADDVDICERFLGEGYLTNQVKSPGILTVFDDGMTDDGCPFLVMDLLMGSTLEDYRTAKGGKLPLREVLDIGDKILDTLNAVHIAGIIHRDLKPQNVFLTDDGGLKVLDFGVARLHEDRRSQSKLSMVGVVLGTPSFMAPEQAQGLREKVDSKSDLWSAGAIMFTLLTGEAVHMAPTMQARLLAAATSKARPIGSLLPELPGDVCLVIDTALQFKKEDRWQTAEAMRNALRHVSKTLPPPAPDENFVQRPRLPSLAPMGAAPGADLLVSAPAAPAMPRGMPTPPMLQPPPQGADEHERSTLAIDPSANPAARFALPSSPPGASSEDSTVVGITSASGTFHSAYPPAPGEQPTNTMPTPPPQVSHPPAIAAAVPPAPAAMRPQQPSNPFAPGTAPLPPGVPLPPFPRAPSAPDRSGPLPTYPAAVAPAPAPAPNPLPAAPTSTADFVASAAPNDLTYPPPLDSSIDTEFADAVQQRKRARLAISLIAAALAAIIAFGAVVLLKMNADRRRGEASAATSPLADTTQKPVLPNAKPSASADAVPAASASAPPKNVLTDIELPADPTPAATAPKPGAVQKPTGGAGPRGPATKPAAANPPDEAPKDPPKDPPKPAAPPATPPKGDDNPLW
jgi:serine/threonine-protein kinase